MKRISYVHSLILQRKHKGFVHVFCFIFLMPNPQARRPNPGCNGTGSILGDNGCALRTPGLLSGTISYPWPPHLFSVFMFAFFWLEFCAISVFRQAQSWDHIPQLCWGFKVQIKSYTWNCWLACCFWSALKCILDLNNQIQCWSS